MKWTTLLLLIIIMSFYGCNTHKFRMQKLEKYPMESTIYTAVKLNKKDLIVLLQEKVDESLTQSFSKGSIKINAVRSGEMSIQLKNDVIHIGLPVAIEANLNAFAKASGTLQIRFKTTYNVHADWSLTTDTQPDDFQWIIEPKAKLLGIKIPIEKLSNAAINQIAPKLATTIDENLRQFSDFKPKMNKLLEKVTQPILLDSERDLWLISRVKRIGIAPLFDTGVQLFSNIYSEVEFSVQYQKPKETEVHLPELEVRSLKKQKSQVHINGIFSTDSLSQILRKEMVGMEIPFRKKQVKIEDISIDFAGRLLRAKIKVSGGINGYIDASGAPYMNQAHTALKIGDFDLKLTGSNLFVRQGIKLFKQKIKKTLEVTINRKIHQLSEDIINKLNKSQDLLQKNENLTLKVLPDKEILFNFELRPARSLHLQISLNGYIQLNVKN